ncbi:Coiled-coil domain-containing protein 186 [Nymphon striatum]|nr:Coiled-coil domain-containing protein 186 [Nymphon striatum]
MASEENKRDLSVFLSEAVMADKVVNKTVVVAGGFLEATLVPTNDHTLDTKALESTHKEADTRIILHCIHTTAEIVVSACNTDVLLLLLAHFSKIKCNELWMKAGTFTKPKYILIHTIRENQPFEDDDLETILPFYAKTGCDSLSYLSGHTKKTVRGHHQEVMPPTSDELTLSLRANYQAHVSTPEIPPPTETGGWRLDGGKLKPVGVLKSLPPVPKTCKVIAFCGCKKGCVKNYGCKPMECTPACKCYDNGIPCKNRKANKDSVSKQTMEEFSEKDTEARKTFDSNDDAPDTTENESNEITVNNENEKIAAQKIFTEISLSDKTLSDKNDKNKHDVLLSLSNDQCDEKFANSNDVKCFSSAETAIDEKVLQDSLHSELSTSEISHLPPESNDVTNVKSAENSILPSANDKTAPSEPTASESNNVTNVKSAENSILPSASDKTDPSEPTASEISHLPSESNDVANVKSAENSILPSASDKTAPSEPTASESNNVTNVKSAESSILPSASDETDPSEPTASESNNVTNVKSAENSISPSASDKTDSSEPTASEISHLPSERNDVTNVKSVEVKCGSDTADPSSTHDQSSATAISRNCVKDSMHSEPAASENVLPSSISQDVINEQSLKSSIVVSATDRNDDSSISTDAARNNTPGKAKEPVPLKELSIPVLLLSSVEHVDVRTVSITNSSNNGNTLDEYHVGKQSVNTANKDDLDDDELLSQLESELQHDSDTSSQATDILPSDDDFSNRLSHASSDISLNLSNITNSLVKCESEIDVNSEGKRLSMLSLSSISRCSSSSNSSNSNQDCYGRGSEYQEIQMEALEENHCAFKAECQPLQTKIKLNRMYDSARKEKESMVMKFANSEKEKLKTIKFKEDMDRRVREAGRDREMLLGKMKQLTIERSHMNSNLETKIAESHTLIRENERLKEEISSKDVKIKWAQNKLKSEVDAHKETQSKLEKVHQKLLETREESEQIRRDCQDMIRRYQDSEEIKSVSLNKELKVRTTELEMQKRRKSEQEEVWLNAKEELDSFKQKHREITQENYSLTVKIQNLEKERLDHVQTVSKLKDQVNNQKQEIVDLKAKLAEMDSVTIQLEREKEKVSYSQKEVERLRQTNAELQSDMDACHIKEGELLEFTQRITSKNVQLQNDLSCVESKLSSLETEVNDLTKYNSELEQHLTSVQEELNSEKALRQQETQILARKLAEKTKAWEKATTQLGDSNNENRVLKRRHLASVKELTRELHQNKKRLELYELNNQSQNGTVNDRMSFTSRTSSSCSLDTLANNQHINNTINQQTPSVTFIGVKDSTKSNSKASESPPETLLQPDRQMLIEKIVKLQKIHARKREKIEFLEEHISQLLMEIKKKSKLIFSVLGLLGYTKDDVNLPVLPKNRKGIIQNYILREEAGALVSNLMDENKSAFVSITYLKTFAMGVYKFLFVCYQAELARKGGIMASVYHSHSQDGAMTLDLSLEINCKLQAVLEDTLLKNITLKENINTLGEEVSRLTCKNTSSD